MTASTSRSIRPSEMLPALVGRSTGPTWQRVAADGNHVRDY